MIRRITVLVLMLYFVSPAAFSQKKQSTFRDTLDNKLDMSNFLIHMNGFVPWPVIISEPALGNFGGALALAFISPQKDAVGDEQYHFPTITGVAGLYTLNNSWGVGAMRQGCFPKIGLRYTVMGGYADLNLSFFREIKYFGRQEFVFNMRPIFASIDLSENVYKNKFFAGLNYQFVKMYVSHDFPRVSDSIFNSDEFDKDVGTLGGYLEMDYRNSIFTPDRGIRLKTTYSLSRSYFGSDFDFDKFEAFTNVFIQPLNWWVCGVKGQWTIIGENAPFYAYPYLTMRGLSAIEYQGQQTLSFETEQRFDLNIRWSLVGFVGTGRTFSDSKFMDDPKWHTAGGAGFRYLLSRVFKLRGGIDIAKGPDQWAYYIVFGHYWNSK